MDQPKLRYSLLQNEDYDLARVNGLRKSSEENSQRKFYDKTVSILAKVLSKTHLSEPRIFEKKL